MYSSFFQVWRWLFETKNAIMLQDRAPMLQCFKSLVYADTTFDFERLLQGLKEGEHAQKYPNFILYIDGVCELRQDWSIIFRDGFLLRGNQTNNNAEAQFLVMKDGMLSRVKCHNINELFQKVVIDLEQHYIRRLISVSSGSFDLITCKRFRGVETKLREIGFKIPEAEEVKMMLDGVLDLGEKLYKVPSCSNMGVTYLVDMNIGLCECKKGLDGSPCKHQYLLWSNRISGSPNFLPFFSATDRMHFSKLATGSTLQPEMYEGIHDRVLGIGVMQPDDCSSSQASSSALEPQQSQEDVSSDDHQHNLECKQMEARGCLQNALSRLDSLINVGDPSLLNGLVVFSKKVDEMTPSQIASSLHKFGKVHFAGKRSLSSSILKKAQRSKIGVQPSSVARRKSKNKGKGALPHGVQSTSMVPVKPHVRKRSHCLAECVSKSQRLGITHEKLMKSKVPNRRKRTSVKKET